jgi:hypothetical protein
VCVLFVFFLGGRSLDRGEEGGKESVRGCGTTKACVFFLDVFFPDGIAQHLHWLFSIGGCLL